MSFNCCTVGNSHLRSVSIEYILHEYFFLLSRYETVHIVKSLRITALCCHSLNDNHGKFGGG